MNRPPASLLAAAAGVGLLVAVVVTLLALGRPWLGLELTAAPGGAGALVVSSGGPSRGIGPGTVLVGISNGRDAVAFEALDFITEPDGMMGDYATYRWFLDRQERIARIQESAEVDFSDSSGVRHRVRPGLDGRPLSSLPPDFWVQVLVGVIAWQVSAAVFAFRPRDAAARYLLLSGAATLLFAPAAAVYTTRELAVPGVLFQWASDLNFLGGSLFAASFLALLLYYPRRIAAAWVGVAVVVFYAVWFVLQEVGVIESMTFARRFFVVVGVLATFVLAGVHWMRTRRDPVARAALQWFLLSWMLGTSLFAAFILLPQMFGVDTSPVQGYAFLLFLLVYGGLAFGILRFRLFELGDWWRRIAVWTLGVLLLVVMDLVFLFGLHQSSGISLSLALLICGVVWLPLRAWAWSWMEGRRGLRDEDLFGRVMDVALAPPGRETQGALWRRMLEGVFDPLQIETDPEPVPEVAVARDGLALRLPGINGIPALRLEFAHGGRRLFSPREAALATELVTMLGHAIESRSAYEAGMAEERGRIARDMHDNIGAQLLAALHSRDPERKDATIRETLADLRDLINNTSADGLSFDETLAELRLETADRLASAGIQLEWQSYAGDTPGLHQDTAHALRSIVREAVSNVIKHAGADQVTLTVSREPGYISLELSDDGCGLDPAIVTHANGDGDANGDGHGLANMRARLAGLRGTLEIRNREGGGTLLAARFPTPDTSFAERSP
ncbi:MAG: ATP-binding protein [Verrucomicrobiales bacterium]|nr:ATP-binding protein [Verrucomicrobiota bacterium JB025]